MESRLGRVTLVGAGPGDPGLLTCRGRACLAEADAVLYDTLASPRLLELCHEACERVWVGKYPEGTAHAPGGWTQAAIEAELVARARMGQHVVRLKGGDPFVFGRGAEEALALVAAGVPFEVVPGIPAAVAVPAYAGIPLTHRGLASWFLAFTGHEDPLKHTSDIQWEVVAAGRGTLLLYMAVRQLPSICARLLSAGLPPHTPAAMIERGTTARQRVLVSTLAELPAQCAAENIGSPALGVVGAVVALRERLAWWEMRPLAGCRVLVAREARAEASADSMSAQLEAAGAEVVRLAALQFAAALDEQALMAALERLPEYDGVVFTSATGVRYALAALRAGGRDARHFAGTLLAVVGPATADALAQHGLRADIIPTRFDGATLATALVAARVRRLLLLRGELARPELPAQLLAAGVDVSQAIAYRTLPAKVPPELPWVLAGGVDVVACTSPSTIAALQAMLDVETWSQLAQVPVAAIGSTTAAAARAAGLTVAVVAAPQTAAGLVAAIVRTFGHAAMERMP